MKKLLESSLCLCVMQKLRRRQPSILNCSFPAPSSSQLRKPKKQKSPFHCFVFLSSAEKKEEASKKIKIIS
ncbi:hypothetical protein SLA2020_259630 [Shorea laevis]